MFVYTKKMLQALKVLFLFSILCLSCGALIPATGGKIPSVTYNSATNCPNTDFDNHGLPTTLADVNRQPGGVKNCNAISSAWYHTKQCCEIRAQDNIMSAFFKPAVKPPTPYQ